METVKFPTLNKDSQPQRKAADNEYVCNILPLSDAEWSNTSVKIIIHSYIFPVNCFLLKID